MNDAQRIPVDRGTDLPSVSVLVGGQPISPEYHLVGVTIQKAVNRIPSAVLTLADGDPSAQAFPVSDAADFVPGNDVEITAGYHRDEQTVFKGLVVSQGLKARRNRPALLVVQLRDAAVKLTAARKSAYYVDMKDSEIIEQILDANGLDAAVTATAVTHANMVRYAATDWDFIVSRAEVNGLVVTVDDGAVTVAPPRLGDSELTLAYGATLMEFEAELDARRQVEHADARAWDPGAQALLEESGDDPGIAGAGNLAPADLAGVIGERVGLSHGGALKEQELKGWADARLLRSRVAKIIGRALSQGYAGVRAGGTVTLSGVGERFSGDAYVSAVQHDITLRNWQTTTQFGLSDAWFARTHDVDESPAAGLLPAVHGLHIGVVTQLGDDPDGEHRVKVVMPIVDAAEEGIWARIACLDAGDERGAFFRPEIGDEVVLGFLNGDPRDPVVLGMLNSSAKPAPLTASDDNHEKGLFTRSKMRIHFNDDSVVMTLDTPNGNTVRLSEEDGGITIEDENGNTLVLTSAGIEVQSNSDFSIKATGDVSIEGTNIELKASAELKADGGAGAEITTGSVAKLKGSLVQIN